MKSRTDPGNVFDRHLRIDSLLVQEVDAVSTVSIVGAEANAAEPDRRDLKGTGSKLPSSCLSSPRRSGSAGLFHCPRMRRW